MSLYLCAVYDVKAQAFTNFFTDKAPGMAVRGFEDACRRDEPNNPLFHHPVDFQLWQLGVLDEASGEFEANKFKLVDAVTFKTPVGS